MLPLHHSHHNLRPSTLPKKREKIPENTIFLGFLRGAGRKPERRIREKIRKEEAENGRYTAVYRDVGRVERGGFKGMERRKPEMLKEPRWGKPPVRLL